MYWIISTKLILWKLLWDWVQASAERPRVRNDLVSVVAVPKKNPVSRAKSCSCWSEFLSWPFKVVPFSENTVVPRTRSFLVSGRSLLQKGRPLYCVVLVPNVSSRSSCAVVPRTRSCMVAKGNLSPYKGSHVKYTVLAESIRSFRGKYTVLENWKYTVLWLKLYGLLKIYGPTNES